MSDAALVTKLPCTVCPSSDAMAEYEGHFFCFSCRTRMNKKGHTQIYNTTPIDESLECEEDITFKVDRFSSSAKRWLYGAGITDKLIQLYHIGYIPELDRVYIPNYRGKELIGYQTRALNFYDKPKYLGKGPKMCYLSKGKVCTDEVVLVEDVLSCIRVGEHVNAISLQGTSLKDEGLGQVLGKFNSVKIWLDADLAGRSGDKKLTRQLCLFVPCSSIVTKRDPKEYTFKEIGEILSKYSKN